MAKKQGHLGEILYKAGVVKKEALVDAIKTSKAQKRRLGEVLLELGLINEDTLTKAIAKQFGLQYVDPAKVTISPEVMKLIPTEVMRFGFA
jgi:type IV pilus assembly protein PilB